MRRCAGVSSDQLVLRPVEVIFSGVRNVSQGANGCTWCGRSETTFRIHSLDVTDRSKEPWTTGGYCLQQQPGDRSRIWRATLKPCSDDFSTTVRFPGWSKIVNADFVVVFLV